MRETRKEKAEDDNVLGYHLSTVCTAMQGRIRLEHAHSVQQGYRLSTVCIAMQGRIRLAHAHSVQQGHTKLDQVRPIKTSDSMLS